MIISNPKKAKLGMDEDIDWDRILEDVPATPGWLRVDEREDAIGAIEHAADTVVTVTRKPLNWKWVIIATHNALQGALVCTLSGTAGVGALSDKSMTMMLEWFEVTRARPKTPKPKERMALPMELYERAKDEAYMGEFGGSPLRTTAEQNADAERLNELRRAFMHFTPKGWSIEEAGLPRMVLNATDIIEQLLLQHPANTVRLDDDQKGRVKTAIDQLRSTLKQQVSGRAQR